MKERSRARALALQTLYAWESRRSGPSALVPTLVDLAENYRVSPRNRLYTDVLVRLVARHVPELDELIQRNLTNWTVARLSVVDRSILRIGAAELSYVDDAPPDVVVREMIRLAERFGTADSPRFIKGVLEAVIRDARIGGLAAGS